MEKLRWKLKFLLCAVTLLLTYLGCHLMIKLCLFSLLESFFVIFLLSCSAGTWWVKIYKTHSFHQSCTVSRYVNFLGILFKWTLRHTNKFRVCWKRKVNVLTSCWDNNQEIQQKTKGHPQIFGTGWTKVPYFNGLIYECIHKNQLN